MGSVASKANVFTAGLLICLLLAGCGGDEPAPEDAVSSNVDPVEARVQEATVLVVDENELPVAGAEVTVSNVQEEFTATDVTDDQGRVTFREVFKPDRISATRRLYAPSRSWGLSEGGQYKVQLLSEGGIIEREAHFVEATVSEHFVVVSQGSSVLAQATVYSFDRPSTVVLEIGESDTLPTGITMTTRPAIATLPTTGRARLQLTIAVGSNVQPGMYELALVPDVRDEERELGEAEGYGTGAGTLSVKVTPVQ
ncbi:MAG: carboxypeptidase-like regulatory domain-containing protein [Chloroflexi bacterium]|nr:carboxypeptidase-like regulatory domain-containing protein [Chloroflexota bacterium]